MNLDDWLDATKLIRPYNSSEYSNIKSVWDDIKENSDDSEKFDNLPEFMWDRITDLKLMQDNYIYTLIDTDEGDCLIFGYHIVNRIGHFISRTNIEIPVEGILL